MGVGTKQNKDTQNLNSYILTQRQVHWKRVVLAIGNGNGLYLLLMITKGTPARAGNEAVYNTQKALRGQGTGVMLPQSYAIQPAP